MSDFGEGWFNPQLRMIYINGDIDSAMADQFQKSMDILEGSDSELRVTVILTTDGGDVYSAMKIYDRIRTSTCTVCVSCIGHVMSAGILIVAAGDYGYRYATENCVFMHHSGSFEVVGEHNNGILTAEHIQAIQEKVTMLIAGRTNRGIKYWNGLNKTSTDHYLTSDDAKKIGLIDLVIEGSDE